MSNKQKLYAYIDESGQDTEGVMFVVSILVLQEERDKILKDLEDIEFRSKKGNTKWHKSHYVYRESYIEEISRYANLKNKIFFEIFNDSKKYIELTSYAAAKAILKNKKHDYIATVFVDGFRKREIEIFTRGLRDLNIRTRKVRGVKREENDVFIRLVDSICGVVRDSYENNKNSKRLLEKRKKNNIINEL